MSGHSYFPISIEDKTELSNLTQIKWPIRGKCLDRVCIFFQSGAVGYYKMRESDTGLGQGLRVRGTRMDLERLPPYQDLVTEGEEERGRS